MDVQKSIQKIKHRQQKAMKNLTQADPDVRNAVFRKSMSDEKWSVALSKIAKNVT